MAPKASLIGLLFVIVLNPSSLPAQDSACTKRTIAVGVVDYAWNLVPNLTAANFRGKVRGQDVQVLPATIDTNPRRIVLLLDASGSMMDPGDGWNAEKSIAAYLIRFAPPRSEIAQIAFSKSLLVTRGFAEDRLVLLRNLSALINACEENRRDPKLTGLYDAVANARGSLGVTNCGDVIYALTDGGDNRSQIKEKRVEEELVASGIRLFAAVITHNLARRAATPEEVDGPRHLRSMVDATGGNALSLPYVAMSEPYYDIKAKTGADAINLALQRMYRQMGEFYRLDVRLPEAVQKPTKWKLEVVNADGEPMKGVKVHYPQELMPCANASP